MANRTTQSQSGGGDYSGSPGDDGGGRDYSRPVAERKVRKERRARADRPVRERRVADRSAGLALTGLSTIVVGAWGAAGPYLGPLFGYKFSNVSSFQWTEPNALLRLAPGAVALLAGLIMVVGGARLGGSRVGPGFWGLMTVACGAWFVIGPAAWILLGHPNPLLTVSPSSFGTFINEVGPQLGLGVLLAAFGAHAMGLLARMTRIVAD